MENNFPAFMRPTAKYFLRNCGLHTWWTLPVVCGADAVFFAAAAPAKQVEHPTFTASLQVLVAFARL